MFIRALTAFLVLPGVVSFAIPQLVAALDPWRDEGSDYGLLLLCVGAALLFWCIRDFYVAGKGTLAPWDPPKKLVSIGLYRYSRNPMYLAVLIINVGWALFFGSWLLGCYSVFFALVFHLRVVLKEEPWLLQSFGADWEGYKQSVPRWLPGRSSVGASFFKR